LVRALRASGSDPDVVEHTGKSRPGGAALGSGPVVTAQAFPGARRAA
jgi:hypothetical protein